VVLAVSEPDQTRSPPPHGVMTPLNSAAAASDTVVWMRTLSAVGVNGRSLSIVMAALAGRGVKLRIATTRIPHQAPPRTTRKPPNMCTSLAAR
jgi:hypothetical protein